MKTFIAVTVAFWLCLGATIHFQIDPYYISLGVLVVGLFYFGLGMYGIGRWGINKTARWKNSQQEIVVLFGLALIIAAITTPKIVVYWDKLPAKTTVTTATSEPEGKTFSIRIDPARVEFVDVDTKIAAQMIKVDKTDNRTTVFIDGNQFDFRRK